MSRQRADFINRITVKWQKIGKSFQAIGHDLLAAKKKLRGEFLAMIETDLPFSARTAECLMSIAKHPRMGKPDSHTCANLLNCRGFRCAGSTRRFETAASMPI
jgi:hypothetical protein